MKRILFLLLLTVSVYGQNPSRFAKIQITANTNSATATKVNVQEADGVVNTIAKNDLIDVVEVNDVPSLPLVGEAGKIYVVKNVNKIYRWNGTFYQELAGSDITYQSIIDALTFTPENVANKTTDFTSVNNNLYPSVQAVKSQLDLKQNTLNWKTPQDYGAIGDGIADDTAAIQACLTANSNVFLYGSYKTSASLEIFSDQFIFSNNATITRVSVGSAILAALNRENIQIKGALTLVGGGNSIGTNSGIRMAGVDNFKIDGVVFKDISGIGLWISSGPVTFPRGKGGLISNIQAIKCYVGLQFDYGYQGEYHSVINFNATQCGTGANIYAGNISISGGNIVDNTLGIYLGGTLASNNSHGILNGLSINHNTLNLRVEVAEFGQTISNCHFYGDAVNNIEIINSKGLVFTNCIIDGKVSNSDTNSPKGAHLVSSSQIGNLTTFSGDYIKKRDNITLTGVDYVGNDYNWGLNGNTYMYAGAIGQRFAYSLAGTNVLYSGTGSFGINDQADATRLLNLTNSGVFSLKNLSGIGNRLVYSDASGILSAPDAPTAPTAAAGTNTNQIATTAFVQAATRPYKVYTALLSQTGTNAPTATVLENTLGGTVVWSRVGIGDYRGTLTGAFISGKTISFQGGSLGAPTTLMRVLIGLNVDSIQVTTNLGASGADTVLNQSSIEIRVYL